MISPPRDRVATGLPGAVPTVGLAAAFQHAFWWAVGFTGVSVLLALVLPGRPRPLDTLPVPEQLAEVGVS